MKEKFKYYNVPEAYFKDLGTRLGSIASVPETSTEPVHVTFWTKVEPYVTLAACFVMAVVAGTLFLGKSSEPVNSYEIGFEDYVYADIIPVTNPFYIYEDYPVEESEEYYDATHDDIIDYLINSGTTAEYLAYMLND